MTEQDELSRINAELQTYKQAFPTCDKHKPSGSRGGCLVCEITKLNAALSQISYECDEPNEYHCSAYDMDYDEQQVIKQVAALKAENAALRKCVELYADKKNWSNTLLLCSPTIFKRGYRGYLPARECLASLDTDIGPQRASPKSVAAINAEVAQRVNELEANP